MVEATSQGCPSSMLSFLSFSGQQTHSPLGVTKSLSLLKDKMEETKIRRQK
jgi:hypothetical protein